MTRDRPIEPRLWFGDGRRVAHSRCSQGDEIGRAISSAILARVRRQHNRVTPGPAARTTLLDGRLGIECGRLGRPGLPRIGFGRCEHYSLQGKGLRLGIGFGRRNRFGRRGVPLGVLNAGRRRRPKPNTPLRGGPPHRPKLWDVGFGRRRIRRRGRDVRRGIGFGRRRHICRRGRDLCLGVGFGRRKRVGRDIGQHGRLGIGFGRRLHFGRPGRTACLLKCPASRIPRVAALIYRNSGTPYGAPSMIFSAREYPGGRGVSARRPRIPAPIRAPKSEGRVRSSPTRIGRAMGAARLRAADVSPPLI